MCPDHGGHFLGQICREQSTCASPVSLCRLPPVCPSLHIDDGRQTADTMEQPTRQEQHIN